MASWSLRLTSERRSKSGERGVAELNSFVRNIEIRRDALAWRYQQKYQQSGRLQ
jgi:hypothetical protein